MSAAQEHVYSETRLAGLLRDLLPEDRAPSLASDMALVLRHASAQSLPLPFVPRLLRAVATSVDPQRLVNHCLRYLDNVADAAAFWALVGQHQEPFLTLLPVFANAPFLCSILWRRPALLDWLLQGALHAPAPTPAQLSAALQQRLCGLTEEAEVGAVLRSFTLEHLLRIGARDLCHLAEVADITADLSALADSVLQAGLEACERWLQAQYGAPRYRDADGVERPCGFCIIGMGKLGGYELNFSSDVDLMYVYTSYAGETSGVGAEGQPLERLSNHEYFIALARRLTTLVGGQGPEGQAFRIDLRLRPEGTQGQLALSLLSYEAYYARLGQTWEKMALLKARPVAGDAQLGAEFLALVQPFVYQSHLDASGVRQLRALKGQIDLQLADKAQSRTNVKLGLGGIREIEFLIQLPQLLYGGRQPALRERHSLRALSQLRQTGLLTPPLETLLRATYVYLRRLEHYLQMEQGAQTHMLPRRAEQQTRLARHFGHPTWEAFYQEYLQRTEAIHSIFVETFRDHEQRAVEREPC
ncbi:MAG: hypothetical protein AB7N91_06540 [Candidatus Tectimicrobiota bacterium]